LDAGCKVRANLCQICHDRSGHYSALLGAKCLHDVSFYVQEGIIALYGNCSVEPHRVATIETEVDE